MLLCPDLFRVSLVLPLMNGECTVIAHRNDSCDRIRLKLTWDNPWVKWLAGRDHAVSLQELHTLPQWLGLTLREEEELVQLGGEILVPLCRRGEMVAILILGPKSKGDSFTKRDLDLLNAASLQGAALLENAHLYHQLKDRVDELHRTQSQLVRTAKLAAMGDVSVGVAHEISSPLQAIISLTYLARHECASDSHTCPNASTMQRDLHLIEKEVESISSIMTRLLGFARTNSSKWEAVDANEVVRFVFRLNEGRFTLQDVKVSVDLDSPLPFVWGDEEQLKQVFLNLVNNALDAMPQKGTLSIETREVDGQVVIAFADTGVGIPADKLNCVFDPFFTTKPSGKGTGLGLALSYSIVDGHGGTIVLESEEGVGTRVEVKLPVHSHKQTGARREERALVYG